MRKSLVFTFSLIIIFLMVSSVVAEPFILNENNRYKKKSVVSGFSIFHGSENTDWGSPLCNGRTANSDFKAPISYLKVKMNDLDSPVGFPIDVMPANSAGSILEHGGTNLAKPFRNSFSYERFLANSDEMGFGAPPNLISCALENFGYDEKKKMYAVSLYYNNMAMALYNMISAMESIAAIDNYLGNPALHDVGISDGEYLPPNELVLTKNPFYTRLVSEKQHIIDNSPSPAQLSALREKINDDTSQFFVKEPQPGEEGVTVMAGMEAERRTAEARAQYYEPFLGIITGDKSQSKADYYSAEAKKYEAKIRSVKAINAPWTFGSKFNEIYQPTKTFSVEFENPSNPLSATLPKYKVEYPGQALFEQATREQLIINRQKIVDTFNELQILIIKMNNENFDGSALNMYIKSALDTKKVSPYPRFDPSNRDETEKLKASTANYLLGLSGGIENYYDAYEDGFWEDVNSPRSQMMMVGVMILTGFITGPFSSATALLRGAGVGARAGEYGWKIYLGLAAIGADIAITYPSVKNAIDSCDEAFTRPLEINDDEELKNIVTEFGPSVYTDYKACLTSEILAGINIALLIIPDVIFNWKNKGLNADNIPPGPIPISSADYPVKASQLSLQYIDGSIAAAQRRAQKVYISAPNYYQLEKAIKDGGSNELKLTLNNEVVKDAEIFLNEYHNMKNGLHYDIVTFDEDGIVGLKKIVFKDSGVEFAQLKPYERVARYLSRSKDINGNIVPQELIFNPYEMAYGSASTKGFYKKPSSNGAGGIYIGLDDLADPIHYQEGKLSGTLREELQHWALKQADIKGKNIPIHKVFISKYGGVIDSSHPYARILRDASGDHVRLSFNAEEVITNWDGYQLSRAELKEVQELVQQAISSGNYDNVFRLLEDTQNAYDYLKVKFDIIQMGTNDIFESTAKALDGDGTVFHGLNDFSSSSSSLERTSIDPRLLTAIGDANADPTTSALKLSSSSDSNIYFYITEDLGSNADGVAVIYHMPQENLNLRFDEINDIEFINKIKSINYDGGAITDSDRDYLLGFVNDKIKNYLVENKNFAETLGQNLAELTDSQNIIGLMNNVFESGQKVGVAYEEAATKGNKPLNKALVKLRDDIDKLYKNSDINSIRPSSSVRDWIMADNPRKSLPILKDSGLAEGNTLLDERFEAPRSNILFHPEKLVFDENNVPHLSTYFHKDNLLDSTLFPGLEREILTNVEVNMKADLEALVRDETIDVYGFPKTVQQWAQDDPVSFKEFAKKHPQETGLWMHGDDYSYDALAEDIVDGNIEVSVSRGLDGKVKGVLMPAKSQFAQQMGGSDAFELSGLARQQTSLTELNLGIHDTLVNFREQHDGLIHDGVLRPSINNIYFRVNPRHLRSYYKYLSRVQSGENVPIRLLNFDPNIKDEFTGFAYKFREGSVPPGLEEYIPMKGRIHGVQFYDGTDGIHPNDGIKLFNGAAEITDIDTAIKILERNLKISGALPKLKP